MWENKAYQLRRSNRRSVALEITREGQVLVRAPMRMSREAIDRFVADHSAWIEKHLAAWKTKNDAYPEPDDKTRAAYISRAKAELPVKAAKYGALMGVTPACVKITGARTRFGSCSGKNSICFSWRLMQYPEAAVDYVVVHELAHILHKNHSAAFYQFVAQILPDWRERETLLR